MRLILLFLSGLSLAGCIRREEHILELRNLPNLILIIADDMAWDDCGAYGHPSIRTPAIDRLAKEGLRFDQAFLTTSSCSPSRASILTGRYPHNTDAEQLHWPVPADQITFVEHLRKAGYWTALGGKYHLGDAMRNRFDVIREVGTAGFQLSSDGKDVVLEGDGSGCESWVPLLKNRPADKPFFLWLAAVDPHRPYQANSMEQPYRPEQVRVPPYLPDTRAVREDLALYYDEISRMDQYIGKVLSELDTQGIADQTLVLFISDNGRPFPRDKTTLYDGGIKTPFIVRWPERVKPGTATSSMVSSLDIGPTFLALAGLEPLPTFEGTDFSPILENSEAKIREDIYAEDHWHDVEDFTRAVRTTQFKYIRNYLPELPNTPPADALRSPTFRTMQEAQGAGTLTPAQRWVFLKPRPEEELYDVIRDPFELNNLATDPAYRDQLTEMRARLQRYWEASGDHLPDFPTPDEFDRTTGQPLPVRERPRPDKATMRKMYGNNN